MLRIACRITQVFWQDVCFRVVVLQQCIERIHLRQLLRFVHLGSDSCCNKSVIDLRLRGCLCRRRSAGQFVQPPLHDCLEGDILRSNFVNGPATDDARPVLERHLRLSVRINLLNLTIRTSLEDIVEERETRCVDVGAVLEKEVR